MTQGQLVVEIGDTELQLLVRCIPESVPSAELGVWLSHSIIPFILQHRTQSLVRMTNNVYNIVSIKSFVFVLSEL